MVPWYNGYSFISYQYPYMVSFLSSRRVVTVVIIGIVSIFFLAGVMRGVSTGQAKSLADVEKRLEEVKIQYAALAATKTEHETHCSIAKEQSDQLKLLHGQAERLRSEKSLLLSLMGKGEGTR